MKKEALKQELLGLYKEALDIFLSDIEDAEDFAEFERDILLHRERQSKVEAEVVQKHKTFFP